MDKIKQFILIAFIIAAILGIVSALATFGGTIMGFFGFTYNSTFSLVVFFAISTIIGFLGSFIIRGIARFMLISGIGNPLKVKLMFIAANTFLTAISMSITDIFMWSVSATVASVFVFALLLAIISSVFLEN